MIVAAAAAHCCDGEELRVPGSPQPYARRVRGSWRDYLQDPPDVIVVGDDDDDDDERSCDSYGDDSDDNRCSDDDGCSCCCSLCSSGGRRDVSPAPSAAASLSSSRSSSPSESSSSSSSSAAAAAVASSSSRGLVFEPSMRGSCRCLRCQKRRYSLDFFKSTDFRRGVPSPNVYMADERSSKIAHDYIHGKPNMAHCIFARFNTPVLIFIGLPENLRFYVTLSTVSGSS